MIGTTIMAPVSRYGWAPDIWTSSRLARVRFLYNRLAEQAKKQCYVGKCTVVSRLVMMSLGSIVYMCFCSSWSMIVKFVFVENVHQASDDRHALTNLRSKALLE
jgi:hypothetical protein